VISHGSRVLILGQAMRRRDFIEGLAASVAWPLAARAQQARTAKVGLLLPGAGPPVPPRGESFREGLRRSGYVEGQNVTIELRYTQAGQEQLADHAADLVRANVDVIATFGDGPTKIAQGGQRYYPDCHYRRRSPWVRAHRQSVAARGQYHWHQHHCRGAQRKATGAVVNDCAGTISRCLPVGSGYWPLSDCDV